MPDGLPPPHPSRLLFSSHPSTVIPSVRAHPRRKCIPLAPRLPRPPGSVGGPRRPQTLQYGRDGSTQVSCTPRPGLRPVDANDESSHRLRLVSPNKRLETSSFDYLGPYLISLGANLFLRTAADPRCCCAYRRPVVHIHFPGFFNKTPASPPTFTFTLFHHQRRCPVAKFHIIWSTATLSPTLFLSGPASSLFLGRHSG